VPEPFDPYREWLDIRGGERPPDHYALLGLKPLESDPQAIANAADMRMARIRKIRPGTHLPDWGRLLDQLQAAKICLLDPHSKAAYDASLPKQMPSQPAAPQAPTPASPPSPTMATPPTLGGMWGSPSPTGSPPASTPSQGAAPEQPSSFFPDTPPAFTSQSAPQYPGQYAPTTGTQPQAPAQPTTPIETTSYGPVGPHPAGGAPGAWDSATQMQPTSGWQPETPSWMSMRPPSGIPIPPAGQFGQPAGASIPPAGQAAPMPTNAPPSPASPWDQPLATAPTPMTFPASASATLKKIAPTLAVIAVLLVAIGALAVVLKNLVFSPAPEPVQVGMAQTNETDRDGRGMPGSDPSERPANLIESKTSQGPLPKTSVPEEPAVKTPTDPAVDPPEPVDPRPPEPRPVEPDPPEPANPSPTDPNPPQPANPEAAVDAGKQAAFTQAASAARLSMSEHDLATAAEHLESAAANAQTPEERQQAVRLQTMLGYLKEFWEGMRQSVAQLGAAEELVLKTTRVAVVDSSREVLVVRAAGQNRSWRIENMPMSITMAIFNKSFRKDATSKVLLGTFLAVDPDGDRAYARQLWREAAQQGFDLGDLMEELGSFGGASGAAEPIKRLPPATDPIRLRQAEQSMREQFHDEYASADTAVKKLRLAQTLLAHAAGASDDPDARFVILRDARDLATEAGNLALAGEAIDAMAKYYEVDALEAKVTVLETLGAAARGLNGHREVALGSLTLLQEALGQKRFDQAERLATVATDAARGARSTTLIKQAADAAWRVEALKNQGSKGS